MHFSRYARKGGRRRAAPAWWAFGLLLATAGAPAVSATASAVHAPSQSKAQPGSQRVSYRGYTFTIPRTWRVIRLAAHPQACVRFDRHVLYLGVPGPSQQCPSTLIGTTEALLVQPAAPRGHRGRGHVPGGSPDHGDRQADHGDRDLLRRFRRPGPGQPHPGRRVAPGPGAGRGGAARRRPAFPATRPPGSRRPARCCPPARPTSPARVSMPAPRRAPPPCRPGCGSLRTGRWASTSAARTGPAPSPASPRPG